MGLLLDTIVSQEIRALIALSVDEPHWARDGGSDAHHDTDTLKAVAPVVQRSAEHSIIMYFAISDPDTQR